MLGILRIISVRVTINEGVRVFYILGEVFVLRRSLLRLVVVSQCRTFCVKPRAPETSNYGTTDLEHLPGVRSHATSMLVRRQTVRTFWPVWMRHARASTQPSTTVTHLGRLARSALSRSEFARLLSGALVLCQGAGCSNRRSACALCCVCVDL